MPNKDAKPPKESSTEALQIQFNEYMHRMLVLELIPSMLASGVNPKEINQWQLEHPYQIFEWLDLESLVQKAVTEAELKARIDELILFPVKGEPGYEDLPKYRLARLATLMNQDKVG